MMSDEKNVCYVGDADGAGVGAGVGDITGIFYNQGQKIKFFNKNHIF